MTRKEIKQQHYDSTHKIINGIEYKKCSKCGDWYPCNNDYFALAKDKMGGLRPSCKICEKKYRDEHKEEFKQYRIRNREHARLYSKQYEIKNKERIKEYLLKTKEHRIKRSKEYREKNKEIIAIRRKRDRQRDKNSYLKRNYNLTLEEFNEMILKQNNKCAICGCELKFGNGGMAIDHDHKTGKIRELLCANCNTVLGHFENEEKVKRMFAYLELHKSV